MGAVTDRVGQVWFRHADPVNPWLVVGLAPSRPQYGDMQPYHWLVVALSDGAVIEVYERLFELGENNRGVWERLL